MNEILCQISTFLAAGHETSSSALTWTLYALARAPAVQARLREELLLTLSGTAQCTRAHRRRRVELLERHAVVRVRIVEHPVRARARARRLARVAVEEVREERGRARERRRGGRGGRRGHRHGLARGLPPLALSDFPPAEVLGAVVSGWDSRGVRT